MVYLELESNGVLGGNEGLSRLSSPGVFFKVSVNPRLERHAVTRFSEVCEVYFTA